MAAISPRSSLTNDRPNPTVETAEDQLAMILELMPDRSLLRNRHRAKPCVEREALISRRTSELLPGDQNCPAARAKFLVRGRRQAILQQAHSSNKSKIITVIVKVECAGFLCRMIFNLLPR
jgi:hypothetical protein